MLRQLPRLLALVSMVAVTGCGGSNGGNGGAGSGGGGAGSGGSAGGGSAGSGGTGGSGGTTATGPWTVQFGPYDVGPGLESTKCVVKRLGNTNAIHVGAIHNVLGDASHHMIVYEVSDTVEQTTPFACQPFQDALDPSKGAPLVISQKKDDTLQLPPGVGFSMQPNQMIRLEMHYINANPTQTVTLTSTATLSETVNFTDEAAFLFVGDPTISVPYGDSQTAVEYFPVASTGVSFANAKFFALTGHEHKLGTGVTVGIAASATDPGTMVYDPANFIWSEPPTIYPSPAFQVPTGGGFTFQCQWHNPDMTTVAFGESANNEMCFFWAYYYPSQGSRVCLHAPGQGDHCLTN